MVQVFLIIALFAANKETIGLLFTVYRSIA